MAQTDYVVRLRGKDELSGMLSNVKNSLKSTSDAADRLDEIQQHFKRIAESTKAPKQQLREMQKLLSSMNFEGLNNTSVFTEIAERAGQIRDAVSDAGRAVNAFASDTFKLEAIGQGLGAIASAGTMVTGAMEMLGVTNNNVLQSIKKLQAALTLLNGVQGLANVLNKDSVVVLRLKQIHLLATKAVTEKETAALAANSVATGANTIAQKLAQSARQKLNYTIAVGKALLGDWTGLVLVGAAALTTYAIATAGSSDELESQAKATEKAASATDNYRKKVSDNIGESIGKFMGLKVQWENLKTVAEKTKWIQDNQSAFNALGLAVTDLNTAEDVFSAKTSKIVASLEARAKAAAAMEMITQAYKDYYARIDENSKTVEGGGKYNVYRYDGPKEFTGSEGIASATFQNMIDKYGLKLGKDYTLDRGLGGEPGRAGIDTFRLMEAGIKKMEDAENSKRNQDAVKRWKENNASAAAERDASVGMLRQEYEQAVKEIAETDTSKYFKAEKNGGARSSSTSKQEEVIDENSLKFAENKLRELQDMRLKVSVEDTGLVDSLNADIAKWEEEVKNRKLSLGIIKAEVVPESRPESEPTIKMPEADKYFASGSSEDKRQSVANAQSMIERLKSDVKLKIIGADEAMETISHINASLRELELEPIEIHINSDGELETLQEQIESMIGQLEASQDRLESVTGSIGQMGSAFGQLGNAIGGTEGKWIGFAGTMASTTAQTLADISKIIMANQAKAIAETAAANSGLPFPASLAAIAAAVAGIMGIFASLPKFAEGGIVPGSSFSGDRTLIRANAGEMVLNKTQQNNLYRAIKDNDLGGGSNVNVSGEFRIKTGDLVAVISNHNSKIRKQS